LEDLVPGKINPSVIVEFAADAGSLKDGDDIEAFGFVKGESSY
jgi:hypothetical protein